MKTLRGRAAAPAVALTAMLFALAGTFAFAFAGAPGAAAGAVGPAVFAVDDETRVRRTDDPSLHGRRLTATGGEVLLQAFPGETPAFQIVIVAGERPVTVAALDLRELVGRNGVIATDIFREHYLTVSRRSSNEQRPGESLGWPSGARPADSEMLGEVPDALLPVSVNPAPVAPGPDVPAHRTGAFWVDLPVPETAAPGDYVGEARAIADGETLAAFRVRLQVRGPVLPYRATSAFVFYEPPRMAKRIGAARIGALERQLWQLLHAHRLDAVAPLADAATAVRLRAAYDGTLFRPEAGYRGPGLGQPPAVVSLGTYGTLGAPSPEAFERLDAVLASLPLSALAAADLFVYAVDEQCASPRAGAWRRLLAARAAVTGSGGVMLRGARVLVGQTCDDPPARQDVDVALVSAVTFARATTDAARAAGRRAWIYNGYLPRTGTMQIDASPRGLTANGWIAAATAIERWFYWESTFWDDGNRGGRGPIDPFVTAESFHNAGGDTSLDDGLLLYPGWQEPPFAAHSLGRAELLPSLRLKSLRRGLEDAGLIALAARERPEDVARVIADALPAVLDEARLDRPASWEAAPRRFSQARAALRALVTRADPMSAPEVRAAFEDLAARRRRAIPSAPALPLGRPRRAAKLALAGLALVLAVGLIVVVARRARSRA
jgi:hypothetical protein